MEDRLNGLDFILFSKKTPHINKCEITIFFFLEFHDFISLRKLQIVTKEVTTTYTFIHSLTLENFSPFVKHWC